MKHSLFTKNPGRSLIALILMCAGLLWAGKAEASCKASFTDSAKGKTIVFYSTSSAANLKAVKFVWHFGDGSVSRTGSSTYHAYSSYNTSYTACLLIEDTANKCIDSVCTTVTTGGPPCSASASFTFKVDSNGKVVFTNSSSTTSGHYKSSWDFEDKTSSTDKSPTHTFKANGVYHVCLLVTDSVSGTCTASYCTNVTVNTSTGCIASYAWSVSGGTLSTSNSSITHNAYTSSWNWGDGSASSTDKSPHHTYTKNGTYIVCLSIYDSIANCSNTKCDTITISGACTTTYSFKVSGYTVAFTDSGSTGLAHKHSVIWKFNDGSSNVYTDKATHTFPPKPATFSVCCYIYDSVTACSSSYCQNISVNGCTLTASFTDSVNGYEVYFRGKTNASKHSKIEWYFGDGKKDSTSGLNVGHLYDTTTSSKTVYILVYDSATGCTTYYSQVLSFCQAVASFSYSINGQSVNFGTSTGNASYVKYAWNFGDKGTSDSKNPTHTFASSGTYDVCLTATDSVHGCKNTICQNITLCTLIASFTDSIAGHTVYFKGSTNASSHRRIEWYFGDGALDSSASTGLTVTHSYASTVDSANVYLRIYDSTTKCLYYATKKIALTSCKLTASFTDSVTGHTVYLNGTTNASSHRRIEWAYGSGVYDSTSGLHASHTYSGSVTSATIYLIVYDSTTKCTQYVSHTIGFCHLSGAWTYAVSGKTVKFIPDSTNPSGAKYYWGFGDGSTSSTLKDPTHTYSTSGKYRVCLYVSDSPCSAEVCDSVTISSSTSTYCIAGKVTTGKTAGYPCEVYLISYDAKDSSLGALDSTTTDSTGAYIFCSLANGTYYTKAALLKKNVYYTYFIPTYHVDATKWSGATKITVSGSSITSADIKMKLGTNPGGAGFIGGKIKAGANKTGDAEANVLVILYDANQNPVTYTYTNSAGYYSFSGIAFGTYAVEGEIPGKVCYPAIVTITDTTSTNNNVDLNVNITTITAAIQPIPAWVVEKTTVFPNPVTEKMNMSVTLQRAEAVNITIFDMTGKAVSSQQTTIGAGLQNVELDASKLPNGLYLLRMEMPNDNKIMEARFVKAH